MPLWARLLALFALLYLFLVAIEVMSGAFKFMGSDQAKSLFEGVANPFAGLAVGILSTVLVQSSSVSTATIVALVGSGELSVSYAVPMIMGANIGTTVTNTMVSLAHVRQSQEFRRAFAAATMHDFFNVLAVGVMLPLELATGFLSKTATAISDTLVERSIDVGDAGSYTSPIKIAVKAVSGEVKHVLKDVLGLDGTFGAVVMLALGLGLIFVSLTFITKIMRVVIAGKAEQALNAMLARSGLLAMAMGVGITVAVQSSSITTSLLVPLCASGVLSARNAFPVMLGANIGTTITALLASVATGSAGLTIALVHVLFNVVGVLLVYPIPSVRAVPVKLARSLAKRCAINPVWAFGYVGVVFVLMPLLGIVLFR
ncbi:MAG TPA: Na/Pi symporter [Planctomycetota bacterium]